MTQKQKIAVLGAGSWGSALSKCLVENGHQVIIYGNNAEDIDEINTKHTNYRYLKNIMLPEQLKATTSLEEAITDAEYILFVVPTNVMRIVAKQVKQILKHKPIIIHAGKGLEKETHLRISEVLKEELEGCYQDIVVLSGPSHAEEVAKKDLTSITAASVNTRYAKQVQQLFMNDYFRVYTNTDVIGVELGAALKNIIAIGSGMLSGLGYGDNATAGLVTRGLAEISRLGAKLGANPLTFIGLSGVGDLIVTCTSVHSRNWQLGYKIAKGEDVQKALDEIGMIVEGMFTVQVVVNWIKDLHIEMPITQSIYNILYQHKSVQDEITKLMLRTGKSE